MNRWIELSYAYIFSCIDNKNRLAGIDKCLHEDTIQPYLFINKHIEQYGAWPTYEHYDKKFKVNAKTYTKLGYTQKEIADLLKDQYIRNLCHDVSTGLQQLTASEETVTPRNIQEIYQTLTDKLTFVSASAGKKLSQILPVLKEFRDNKALKICDFGMPMLDRYTGGIREAQYTVIFGGTSEGKSTYARCIAGNIALQGKKILYLSLEEQDIDSIVMAAGLQAHFNVTNIFDGIVCPTVVRRAGALTQKLRDCGGDIQFLSDVENKGQIETLFALQREYKPDIIILDQITLFTPDGSNDQKDINQTTKILKRFCQSSKTPVIALTQRLRGEKKAGRADADKADIDNIGYAAAVGHDADIVLYVHKTDQDGDTYRKKITIVKNRKRKRYIELNLEWDLDHGIIREVEDYAEQLEDVGVS